MIANVLLSWLKGNKSWLQTFYYHGWKGTATCKLDLPGTLFHGDIQNFSRAIYKVDTIKRPHKEWGPFRLDLDLHWVSICMQLRIGSLGPLDRFYHLLLSTNIRPSILDENKDIPYTFNSSLSLSLIWEQRHWGHDQDDTPWVLFRQALSCVGVKIADE